MMVDISERMVGDDLASLCHCQVIQSVVVPLLLRFPPWSERTAEFVKKNSVQIQSILASPELPLAEWNSEMIGVMGYSDISSESEQRHLNNLQNAVETAAIRGTPQQWISLHAKFIEFCMPRSYAEWYQFSLHGFADEESRPDLILVTEAVLAAMDSGIQARHVAFDIQRLAVSSPVEACARCLTWVTQFLAMTETGWPTPGEIDTYGAVYRWQMDSLDPSQRMTLATLLLSHDSYSGKLDSRGNQEHPFAFLLRRKLTDPPSSCLLLLEVDCVGESTGICVSSEAACVPTENDSLEKQKLLPDDSSLTWKPWADVLNLRLDATNRTVLRMCAKYSSCPPVKIPPAQWDLLLHLLTGGETGVTRKYLAKVLNTSEEAISTRKTGLKNSLHPLDLTIPGDEFRVAEVKC